MPSTEPSPQIDSSKTASVRDLPDEVDIIVVGAGAAGCALVGRLLRLYPDLSITLFESGPTNFSNPRISTPLLWPAALIPGSEIVRSFKSQKSEDVNGREIVVDSGNVLGGGSSVNFMHYSRPMEVDFEDWNVDGWRWKDVEQFFKKFEDYQVPQDDLSCHGKGGPIEITMGEGTFELLDDYLQAADSCGVNPVDDIQNFKVTNGIGKAAKFIRSDGRRSDAATGYLKPILDRSPNFRLVTECEVVKLEFEGKRAIGVSYSANSPSSNGQTSGVKFLRARRQVVISAGTLSTPQILERSGIGSEKLLSKLGIRSIVDLPQVGENFQDHQIIQQVFVARPPVRTYTEFFWAGDEEKAREMKEFERTGEGRLATNAVDVAMRFKPLLSDVKEWKVDDDFKAEWERKWEGRPKSYIGSPAPELYFGDPSGVPKASYFDVANTLFFSQSRGSIHITSPSPSSTPEFISGYLSHPADLESLKWAYKKTRELVRHMKCFGGEVVEFQPKYREGKSVEVRDWRKERDGPPKEDRPLVYDQEDEKALEDHIRNTVGTTYHGISTCIMGSRGNGCVVDNSLNVYGVEGLKVADLSICPDNVACHTYSVALMIGEKAAQILLEDLGLDESRPHALARL